MSILLDALRKSEQRQRAGAVPGIHDPGAEPSVAPYRDSARLVWILLAVVLVALVWLAWRQYAPPSPVPAELPPEAAIATDNAQQPGEAAAGSAAAEKPQAAQGLAAAQAPQGNRTPVESLAAPEPEPVPREKPVADRRAQANDQRSVVPEEKRQSAATAKAPPSPQETGSQRQPESARRQPPPISYWELPKDVRESLPPFKISVLVYAENAEDRFILMNGARQVQADTVVPELQLVEIQRDRVIFSHRNYRFYVKQ